MTQKIRAKIQKHIDIIIIILVIFNSKYYYYLLFHNIK